jgi:hypothetical protein
MGGDVPHAGNRPPRDFPVFVPQFLHARSSID